MTLQAFLGGLGFVVIVVGIGWAGLRFRPSADDKGIDEILSDAEDEDEKDSDK